MLKDYFLEINSILRVGSLICDRLINGDVPVLNTVWYINKPNPLSNKYWTSLLFKSLYYLSASTI